MIRGAFIGAARILFNIGTVLAVLAAGLLYASFRLLKAAYRGQAPAPRRDAMFAVLLAGAALARALQADVNRIGGNDAERTHRRRDEVVGAESETSTEAAEQRGADL